MSRASTALVTGASSGIGAGIVRALAAEGMVVHALARRADRLAALAAETGAVAHPVDVTDGAALARTLAGLAPEVLVLNAGRGGGFKGTAQTPADVLAETVTLNVTSVLEVLRLALPGMIARGRGHVVLMGSVAGLYPSPSALYGATKGAITMMGKNLRLELRGTGVRVTDVRPGRVASEFYDVAMADAAAAARAKETGIRELTPADVAAAVVYAVTAPAHVNVSAIELQPVEQTYGGTHFDPLDK